MSQYQLIYHEKQDAGLCAVHTLNSLLQGQYFNEIDLADIAKEFDEAERQVMMEMGSEDPSFLKFMAEDSGNLADDGNYSVQVIQKALTIWGLNSEPINNPEMNAVRNDPLLSDAFICNMQSHWLAIRKLNGEYWNLNSLLAEPQWLSSFYLSAFLDTLTAKGYTIFVVTGDLPKPVPNTSDKNWKRVTLKGQQSGAKRENTEQQDLEEAIRASLMDTQQGKVPRVEKTQEELEEEELQAAIMLSQQQPISTNQAQEQSSSTAEEEDEDAELAAAIALSKGSLSNNEEKKIEPEPEKGEDTTDILFILPDGNRLLRRFKKDTKVNDLYFFIEKELKEVSFSIRTAAPPMVLSKDEKTLGELGLFPNSKLIIQK